jgi:hypothetical protein
MPSNQLDILAFGINLENLLLGCGGLLVKSWIEGKHLGLVIWSEEKKQDKEALQLIKTSPIYLELSESPIEDSYPYRLKLVETLRLTKPRLVLAPMWEANPNLNQQELGKMLRYVCRLARFSKILPDTPIHRPEGILHYLSPLQPYPPNFVIDVSPYFNVWMEMLACFNKKELEDQASCLASQRGLMIGKNYAQVLVQGNPTEINDLMHIRRGTIEL